MVGSRLRMPTENIPKIALRWTPHGKCNRGRPKTTWRRTITIKLKKSQSDFGEGREGDKRQTGMEEPHCSPMSQCMRDEED